MELLSFLILISAGLFFSEIFNRLHLPYVVALIIAGIIIGPVLNIVSVDPIISFMASIGVIFLMFIAGSEVKLDSLSKIRNSVFALSLINGLIPFLVGFFVATFFGFGYLTSLALGAVFISSSIAVIVPTLEQNKILDTKLGKTITSAVVFEDVGSLIFLSILLQNLTQRTPIPLVAYIPTIIIVIVVLKLVLPRIQKRYMRKKKGKDLFESELRFIFVTLIATVVLFELIGMHAIIAGFIIGLLLSDSIRGKIEEKIRTISYGFFIPIFFIIVGIQTDLASFYSIQSMLFIIVVVVSLIMSKVISGYFGGRLLKFSKGESLLIGFASIPQLSTTLAAAYAAFGFGLLNQQVVSALIVLTLVTVLISPTVVSYIVSHKKFNISKE